MIDRAVWDSDFFGYEIGVIHKDELLSNINFDEVLNYASTNNTKLIYYFSDQEQKLDFSVPKPITIKLADKKVGKG